MRYRGKPGQGGFDEANAVHRKLLAATARSGGNGRGLLSNRWQSFGTLCPPFITPHLAWQMNLQNTKRILRSEWFKLLPIMALAFYLALIPRQDPYALHLDEWSHLAYSNQIIEEFSSLLGYLPADQRNCRVDYSQILSEHHFRNHRPICLSTRSETRIRLGGSLLCHPDTNHGWNPGACFHGSRGYGAALHSAHPLPGL